MLQPAVLNPAQDASPDERAARAVARGIGRLFARNDIWCLAEMPLRSNRRADLMGVDAKGRPVMNGMDGGAYTFDPLTRQFARLTSAPVEAISAAG